MEVRSLSRDELRTAVSTLRTRHAGASAEASRTVLSDCIKELGGLFPVQSSTNNEPRRFFFFRVRTADGFTEEAHQDHEARSFGYPPREICTSVGRAHLPGHPVFYGSDSVEGAIGEMKVPGNTEYYLSVWHTDEMTLERLNLSYASNITADRLLMQKEGAVSDMRAQYPTHSSLAHDRMEALLEAWSDLFATGGEENYPLTSAIGHQVTYGTYRKADVLVYGSAIDGSFVNYAIHPRLADKLNLYRVFSLRMVGDQPGFIQCTDSVGHDGRLTWQPMAKADLPENDPFIPTRIAPIVNR